MKLLLIVLFCTSLFGQIDSTSTIAVTAFVNNTNNSSYAWVEEAFGDMLATDIALSNTVRVISRRDLKSILNEHKLIMSGLVDEAESVKVGSLAGADLLLRGSFTIIDREIRVDAKIYDVSSGTSNIAVSHSGNINELFKIEKILALSLLSELELTIPESIKFEMMQYESKNIAAIERNYLGVIANDNGDQSKALDYFEQATELDPGYMKAAQNYKNFKKEFKGKSLFGDALNQLDVKTAQIDKLERYTDIFLENYYILNVVGSPNIKTNLNNDKFVTIEFQMFADFDKKSIEYYIEKLREINQGDKKIFITGENARINAMPEMKLYKETWEWMKKNHTTKVSRGSGRWFYKVKEIQLLSGDNILYKFKFGIHVGHRDDQLDFIYSWIKPTYINHNVVIYKGNSSQELYIPAKTPVTYRVLLKNIKIDDVEKITHIQIVEPQEEWDPLK
jgi:TolB-like protein